jgi:hypothetical protein
MAILPDINDFPVNETIEFNGQQLKIQRYLQSGYTSNVFAGTLSSDEFQGERPVAIKVIKQVLGEESLRLFHDECKVLEKLMEFERVEDPFTAYVLRAAPIYYGCSQYKGNNYIVMELVAADEINHLIKAQGQLPEEQAIRISWQLFQFLEVLHTKVHKTIFDYKDENFWWTEANGGQIRVIDLGGLPDVREEARFQGNTKLAVLKTSAFLLKVFTGKSLFIPMTQEFDDPRQIIEDAPITWGTKALLKKALHINPKFRLTDAGELKEAFSELYDYWQPGVDLKTVVEENLKNFDGLSDRQSTEAKAYATRAKTLVGILEAQQKLPMAEVTILQERCDKVYEQSEYLMGGKNLFQATDYRSAAAQFKLGLENGENNRLYRDWLLVAEAASQNLENGLTKENRKEMEKVVDHLQAGKYAEAVARLEHLQNEDHIIGLERIIAEAQIFLDINRAKDLSSQEEYQLAASVIDQTGNNLSLLSDLSSSIIAEIGNLQDLYEEYESLARTRGEAQAKQEEGFSLIEKDEMVSAFTTFQNAWGKYPETAFHSAAMIRAMDLLLQRQDFSTAAKFAAFAQNMPGQDQQLFELTNEVGWWYRLYQAFISEDARGFSAAVYSLNSSICNQPNKLKILNELTQKLISLWKEKNESEKLKIIKSSIELTFPNGEQSRLIEEVLAGFENLRSPELVEAVDTGINKLRASLCILNADNLAMEERVLSPFEVGQICANKSEKIRNIRPFFEEIKVISRSIQYRSDELDKFDKQLAQISTDVTEVAQRAEQRKKEADQRAVALESQFKQLVDSHHQLLEDKTLAASPQSQPDRTIFESRLVDLYTEVYQAAQIENDQRGKAAKLLSDISAFFDQASLVFWQRIEDLSSRKLSELNAEKEQLIKQFHQGDFLSLAAWLERKKAFLSENSDYQKLTMQVNQTQLFDQWRIANESRIQFEGYQPDIVESILDAMKFNVPAYYLKKGRVVGLYLERCQRDQLNAIQNSLDKEIGLDQLQLVKQFVHVRKAFVKFETIQNKPD